MRHFEFESDCTATIEDGPVVRWVDPEDGSCLISGFPDERAAHNFVMWADFEERTFKKEAPWDWASALTWEYLPT